MTPRAPLAPLAALAALAACASIAVGCSSASSINPDDFSGAPYATALTDSRALRFDVHVSPAPPVRGTNDAELVVTDAVTGAPRDGLTLAIQPWMPAMNHGAIKPTIVAEGGGKYLVTNLDLFMPGLWTLRTTLSGTTDDHVAPQFQVP